jgi:hypothetical protein
MSHVKQSDDKTPALRPECTCGRRFMDAEDYRDHLPCMGTKEEQEIRDLLELLKLADSNIEILNDELSALREARREQEVDRIELAMLRTLHARGGWAAEVDQLRALVREQDALLDECAEALIWCSGSNDFQRDGQASVGWEKLCRPLITKLRESEKARAAIGDERNGTT